MPRYPVLPLRVRLIARSEDLDEIQEHYEAVRAYWLLQAGIEIERLDEIVVIDDGSLEQVDNWSDPLDALWVEGATWVDVIYISKEGIPDDPTTWFVDEAAIYEGTAPKGQTWFHQPALGRRGYGCVIDSSKATPALLAHEIGHALGVPHATDSNDSDATLESAAYDMAPFADDTLGADDPARNLMKAKNADLLDLDGEDFAQLTPNQVARARLTLVSRWCPLALTFDENHPVLYEGGDPLMADISAPYMSRMLA